MDPMPSLILGQTTLLVAGPHAGKTALLSRWRETTPHAQYLKLTREDAAFDFFLHRFLAGRAEIRRRFEALRAELSAASWGGVLGLAIAEVQPDFCLLLDGFQFVEDAPDWMALLRHFPAEGTLVIASRHRISGLDRAPVTLQDADQAFWAERPELDDLTPLPPELVAKAIALHVVGEGALSASGHELSRRNIAVLAPDDTYQLRPAWRQAASHAASLRLIEPEVWAAVEAELMAFLRRRHRAWQESLLARILGRIPSELRQRCAFVLQVEGDYLLSAGKAEEARVCYQRAMARVRTPESARALRVRLFGAAALLQDAETLDLLFAELNADETSLSPALQARFLFYQGITHQAHDMQAAWHALKQVLLVPIAGDREVAGYHARALGVLAATHFNRRRPTDAIAFADRQVRLSLDHGLHRDLLGAFAARLSFAMDDESKLPPFSTFVDVPNDAFHDPDSTTLLRYLTCFATRAAHVKDFPLALRLWRFVLSSARSCSANDIIQLARYGLMISHAYLGEFEPARRHYEVLRGVPSSWIVPAILTQDWAYVQITGGRAQEAAELLTTESGLADADRRGHLYRAWIRFLEDDATALADAQALIATPDGADLWESEVEVLEQFGLRAPLPRFHLRAFGEPAFHRAGAPALHWPRKKALSLLVALALDSKGLDSAELIDGLYHGSDNSDPAGALRTLIYNLRQVLAPVGAADLLEVTRGVCRFRWEKVARCDLHEFGILYRKGQSLEAEGLLAAAAVFYHLATLTVQGEPFEGLADTIFDAPRRELAARVKQARTLARMYAPHIWLTNDSLA